MENARYDKSVKPPAFVGHAAEQSSERLEQHRQGATNRLSRRDFLKSAALAGVAAAGAGALAGCDDNPDEGGKTPEGATQEYWLPETWDMETEVLVAGAAVGLAAAIEAKESGADVLIIEKADHVGGLWISAGGGCTMGGNNVVQQRDGEVDDNDQWYEDEMWSCQSRGVPEIIRMLVDKGADTVKWMQDLGLVWAPLQAGALRGPTKRGLQPQASADYPGFFMNEGFGSGISWIHVWMKKIEELEIPILLEHRLIKLYREPGGEVLGAEVDTKEGKINIKAKKSVILTTGGWIDNDRMVAAYDPRLVGPDIYGDGGVPGYEPYCENTGDGFLAAEAIGGALSDMSFVAFLNIFWGNKAYWAWEPRDWTKIPESYVIATLTPMVRGDGYQRVIMVKNGGERWVNELEAAQTFPAGRTGLAENPENSFHMALLSIPQPRNVWLVTDSEGAAALNWPLDEIENPNPLKGRLLDPENVVIAQSIEELASKIGNMDKLSDTVAKYNGFADSGVDDDFGKPAPMYKLQTPPFYALKCSIVRHTPRNGLRVNTKSQVIERSDLWQEEYVSIDQEKVIPRLYAAGEAGNIVGYRRAHNSLGHFTTAARVAGQEAAKESTRE